MLLWERIRDRLSEEIAGGFPPIGSKLPTEAGLAARFGANRHTVRRALAALREAGVVESRQGFGVRVCRRPATYRLSQRSRFSTGLATPKGKASMEVLEVRTRHATRDECRRLGLPRRGRPPPLVHSVMGVRKINGQPAGLFRSLFPAGTVPELLRELKRTKSVTAALRRCGVRDYFRSRTLITSEAATPLEARHLGCGVGEPLLRMLSVNVDPQRAPIELGDIRFRGDMLQLVVEPEEMHG